MDLSRTLLLLAACLALSSAQAHGSDVPVFTASEKQKVVALGPWPPAFTPDPSNRVSGRVLAIELGRRLFSDARMSPVGYIGCVTCHQPDRAFTDLRARAHGLADLPRNTPALFNLRQQRWYGWAGASDSLWMASVRPMLDAREFDSSPAFVARVFERDPELAACYRKVFREAPRESRRTVVNVGKALAAFGETLVTGRTPFDEFCDALARGDAAAAAFSSDDTGRPDDVLILQASPFSLLGRYNDAPAHAHTVAMRGPAARPPLRGEFRTPSLRNVTVTGPWMHDGRIERLHDAIRHGPLPGATHGGTVSLTPAQISDLASFIETLTDRYGEQRPWPPASLARCP